MHKLILISILISLICGDELKSQMCWFKGEPDSCLYSLVTEFGVSRRLSKSIVKEGTNYADVDVNVGLLRHVSDKMALGTHFFFNWMLRDRGEYIQMGVRPRFSFFINRGTELNFAPGIILYNSLEREQKDVSGYSIESGITMSNQFGVFTRLDFINRINKSTSTVFNLGIKAKGKKALTLTGLGVLAVVIGAVIVLNSL